MQTEDVTVNTDILQEKFACLLKLLHIDRETEAKGILVNMIVSMITSPCPRE